MEFIKKQKNKKIILINLFLFSYIFINLIDGERGLVSYFEKKNIKNNLIKIEEKLIKDINLVETKNSLLSSNLDLDYLEILYRKKFSVGKPEEKIYIFKN